MFPIVVRRISTAMMVLTLSQVNHWSLKPVNTNNMKPTADARSRLRNSRSDASVSGVSFKALSIDRRGGVVVGGSVFGITGLLLKSNSKVTTAATVNSVGHVQDLSFPSPRNGWMVADNRLFHTNNSGKSWRKVRIHLKARLKSVFFFDALVGWVAGENGLVLQTRDGGVTWITQDSSTTFSLEKIRFVNEDTGWATGSDFSPPETRKLLLLTKNGGRTWRKAPDSDFQQFSSVTFLNSDAGWAVNSDNEVLLTLDGGETWHARRPADGTILESVFFVNESLGWAVGNGIVHTIDGGKTWKYQLKTRGSAEDSFNEVIFTDARNGWAIGLTRILITRNGGAAWEPLSNSWKANLLSRVRREKFKSSSNN